MEQRGGVDEFNRGRQRVVVRARVAQRLCKQHDQPGADAFAAGGHDVVTDLLNQRNVRAQALADDRVDALHVRLHRVDRSGICGLWRCCGDRWHGAAFRVTAKH